jgi:hypothetical protein
MISRGLLTEAGPAGRRDWGAAGTAPAQAEGACERLADRLEPWTNPILVRSLRQALRSRVFLAVYLLVLGLSALAAVVTSLGNDLGAEGEAGRWLFNATVIAWTFSAWFAQPLVAIAAVVRERNEDTWDLVDLTGLPARRVVLGLLATALVQAAVVGAGLAPFLVLSYLLRGVDFGLLLLAVAGIPLGAAVLTALALLIGCLGPMRSARAIETGLLTLGLAALQAAMALFWIEGADDLLGDLARHPELRLLLGMAASAGLGMIYLCCTLAITLLTHPARDRSSGGRLMAWVLLLAWLLWLAVATSWHGSWRPCWEREVPGLVACSAAIGLAWTVLVGLHNVSEYEQVTRRQAQALAAGGRLRRMAMAVLGPGAPRGRRCFLLMVAANLALLAHAYGFPDANPRSQHLRDQAAGLALGLACYGATMLGPVALLLRSGGRCRHPVTLRGMLMVIAGAGSVGLVLVLMVAGSQGWDHLRHPLAALSPLVGTTALMDPRLGWDDPLRLTVLGLGAFSLLVLIARSSPGPGTSLRLTAGHQGRDGGN